MNLPYHLNYALSSYIYQCIRLADEEYGDWLHNEGLAFRGKSYKPFHFSSMHFSYKKNHRTHMSVQGEGWLRVDSIRPDLIQRLMEGMQKKEHLELHDWKIPIQDIQIQMAPDFRETMTYRAISPIVVPVKRGERLHFCYPLESQFYDSIRQSIRNWYCLKWGEEMANETTIHLSLHQPEKFQLTKAAVLTQYKEKKIKGYLIPLTIQAPPKVQQVIYESGLGSYGSQGFGMVEQIKQKNR